MSQGTSLYVGKYEFRPQELVKSETFSSTPFFLCFFSNGHNSRNLSLTGLVYFRLFTEIMIKVSTSALSAGSRLRLRGPQQVLAGHSSSMVNVCEC